MRGLVLKLTNTSAQSFYLHDLVSSPSDGPNGSKAGPFYIHPSQVVRLSNTSDVTRSIETGVIGGFIAKGWLTAVYENGDVMDVSAVGRVYSGATPSAAGLKGIVPAPTAGQDELFLRGDGTWADSLFNPSIGDTPIKWYSYYGTPTGHGATLTGTAVFHDANEGVWLTTSLSSQTGYMFWSRDYDYSENIIFTTTVRAGGGTGADGITVYFGANSSNVSYGSSHGGVSVVLDEYAGGLGNADVISVYANSSLITQTTAYTVLDDNTYRTFNFIYEVVGGSKYLTVEMNGVYVCRAPLGSWTPAGDFVGISGYSGASTNCHACKSFVAKSARAWKFIKE